MQVRWGIIGAGDVVSKRVAQAIKQDPDSELLAVCRRDESKLHEIADNFEVALRFTDARELIAQNEIDAVYIATPVDLHCQLTLEAASAQKHVLVEKPMALSVDECDRMITACEDADVRLGVAYYRRFYPVVSRIAELIDDGALGRILSLGFVTGNPINFPAEDWRVVLSRGGGGPLMDIGSHRVELMLHLLGDVRSVNASMAKSATYEAEQALTTVANFENGSHAILQCYFGTPNVADRLEIIGTGGRVITEDLNAGQLTIFRDGTERTEHHNPAENFNAPLIADFVAAISSGGQPACDGVKGRKVNLVLESAYRAANLRRDIEFDGL